MVTCGGIEKIMGIFGGFGRHAIARQHVEMAGVGKRIDGRLYRDQGRRHQAPAAPAAFDPAHDKGNGGVIGQRRADPLIIVTAGAGVKMDRDAIARRRQPLGLGDDPFGIFVAQKDVGYFRHKGTIRSIVGPRLP